MEKFGGNFEGAENALEQSEMTQEVFEHLIGARIAEIRDFYGGSAEDWLDNFKKNLEDIATLAGSEEAAKFYNKNIQESTRLGIETTMKNLNGLNPEALSKEVKESLLKSLDSLFS